MMAHMYTTMPSPLGELVLTADTNGITGIYPPAHRQYLFAQSGTRDARPFTQTVALLNHYFSHPSSDRLNDLHHALHTLPLAPQGTPFQKRVWQALCDIPCGETRSYGDIAKALNAPTAARAVGMGIGKNPIAILIPCHRVIGATGKLTGYAGGLAAKTWLLQHEQKPQIN